jgi:hypothetical protein
VTPSEQKRQLQAKYPGAVIMLAVCHGRERVFLKDAELVYCSICGEAMKGDVFDTDVHAAGVKVESVADYDVAAIGERIQARRVAAEVSLSTLSDQLAIRADRLCRFEQGTVTNEELPEFLRALVWSADYDAAVVDAYRKPKNSEAAHG